MENKEINSQVETHSASSESSTPSQQTILLNVWFQIINLAIFFFVFYYLFGKKIATALAERDTKIEKIKSADEEYQKIVQNANQEKEIIIDEALSRKASIISEAKVLAEKEKTKIIDWANKKAEDIIDAAKTQTEEIKKQLENSWSDGIKSTVKVVLKKMFNENVELQEKYIDTLLTNLKK